MKRILNIFEILICIVLVALDVWNWKMFYRDDFAVSAAFVHIPALIAYGVLVIILAKKIFTTQKLQSGKPGIKTYFKIICVFIILVMIFFAASVFCGMAGASPADLREFTDNELNVYYLKENVKSFGGAAYVIWPFMAAAIGIAEALIQNG